MSAELPLFERKLTRRGFFRAAGIVGTIYLSPFLTACEAFSKKPAKQPPLKLESESSPGRIPPLSAPEEGWKPAPAPEKPPPSPEIFPPRMKLSEIIRWKEEPPSPLKEIEKGSFLFGQGAFASKEKIVFFDLQQTKVSWELRLPPGATFRSNLDFSPDGKRLVGLVESSLLVLDLVERKTKEIFIPKETSLYDPGVYWSPNGEFLLLHTSPADAFSYPLLPRPAKDYEKGPTMVVFRAATGEIIYQGKRRIGLSTVDQGGALRSGFSPDSQWLVTEGEEQKFKRNVKVFNLKTKESFVVFDDSFGGAAWCSLGENTFVAFIPPRGSKDKEKFILFDLETKGKKVFEGLGSEAFRVLGGGKTLVFLESKRIGVLDLESGNIRFFPLGVNISPHIFFFSVFSSNGEFIFPSWSQETREQEFYGFNLKKGEISPRGKIEKGSFVEEILDPHWVLMFSYPPGTQAVGPLTPQRWFLFSLRTNQKFFLGEAPLSKVSADFLSEGEYLQKEKRLYFFSAGRKYPVSPLTRELLPGGVKSVSPRTLVQIPESENKLEFRGGDLLLGKDQKAWYLRDGKRYPVSDLEKFQKNVQFNRQRYEISPPILEKIPEGKNPLEGYSSFINWDGHLVETHPEGSLLCLFLKGWKSTSEERSFPEIKETLGKHNWTEGRMGDFTYNATKKPNGELELKPYGSEHSSVNPQMATKYLEWQIAKYKQLLPWTKIILIGHSLGGFLAFNAALNQTEAVRAVITLDSPLMGINKTLIGEKAETGLRRLWGDEVVNYLLGLGQAVPKEVMEKQALRLKEAGVDVFTFASTDDLLVPHQAAFLENSIQKLNGFSLNLRFPMGRLIEIEKSWLNPFIFSGDPLGELKEWFNVVASAHSTPVRHPEVLRAMAMIAGKVG